MGGALRPIGGVQFGQEVRIGDSWFSDPGIAFTATIPASEDDLKWRAATYDTFVLRGWSQTLPTDIRVGRGEPLLAGTPEEPDEDTSRPITVTITPDRYEQGLLLAPGIPVATDQDANVVVTGADGWFASVRLDDGREPYTVEARVLQLDDNQELLTANRLEVAGTTYPADIEALYTSVPPGAIGPDARELLDGILEDAGTTNPYRLAAYMQDYLRTSKDFTYDKDLSDEACDGSAVECFARTRHGFCLQYASTMAILLRAADPVNPIPTRLVQGFLPGTKSGGTRTVQNLDAHAWVEVYFPGYGWIPFDPTGGGVGEPTEITEGPVVPPPSPVASLDDSREADPTRRVDGDTDTGPAVAPTSGGPGDGSLLILLATLLAIAVATLGVAAWLRGPRGEMTPDTAWRSMSQAASRFGFGPKPTQTVYEYASALGELVPVARADLQTVADAKVETAYAQVRLGGARLDAVRDATRRLRISLLRLVLRRPRKRRL